MRKIFLVVFILLLASCGEKQYKPGRYTGVGQGQAGEIKVEVLISKNRSIADITVLEYTDTPGISDEVFSKLPPAIINANGTDVDVISGATQTSQGVLDAVNDALKKAVRQ